MIGNRGDSIAVKRHQCDNIMCTWFRDYLTGKAGNVKFIHPEYGAVTYAEAAVRDIAHHDCVKHYQAVQRVHALNDIVKQAKEEFYVGA